ncbi:MAG TPA: hypothetical protein ENN99_13710 [Chloroflexi bacterium]|nr:hypothetical protein [Chloroflexota bacterium]
MSRRWKLFFVLALLLGLTLGCGILGGRKEAESPATVESPAGVEEPEGAAPTQAPSGGAEIEETEELEETLDLPSFAGSLQNLDSYRSYLTMSFEGSTGGEAEQWTFGMEMEYVRDPLAQRFVMTGELAEERFESVQIGGQQYVVFGDECISSSMEEGDELDMEVFTAEDVMGDLSQVRRVRPDETVNGILCRHYVFDQSSVTWTSLTRAQGEAWIAVDGDHVVKFVMEGEGNNPLTDEQGRIEWMYEVKDVNAPIIIEPPSGCKDVQSEYPIMADATELTTMGGMVMYNSSTDFDDVLQFYQDRMAAEGWSEEGDAFITSGMAMLSYTKDGRTVSVTLSEEDGQVSVLVMGE